MQNELVKLEVAEARSIFIEKPTAGTNIEVGEPEKKWKAVWNIDQDKLAAIVSKDYKIVQHKDVVESFTNACNGLNIKHQVKIRNHGNKIFVDVEFTDTKINIKEGEEFVAGFRLINSYDKSTGVIIVPRLVRLVCENGMVMDIKGFVDTFHFRHNQKMVEDFAGYMEVALKDTINSNEKLKAIVNECIGDSVEWQVLDKIMQFLVGKKKHLEQVKKFLEEKKPTNRWELYNAITQYATHGQQLKPNIEMWLQNQAQKVLTTNSGKLLELAELKVQK